MPSAHGSGSPNSAAARGRWTKPRTSRSPGSGRSCRSSRLEPTTRMPFLPTRARACSISSTPSSGANFRRARTSRASVRTARTPRSAGRITSVTSNPRLPFDVDEAIDTDRDARARAVDPRYNVALEASAGTGKTRVLVDRYINLLRAGVDPSNILAITFTRKAATEMRDRIVATLRAAAARGELPAGRWRELRDRIDDIAISTIDAFCLSLLREFPLEADLDPGFDVADETEVPRLVDESLDRALRTCRSLARQDEDIALVFAQLGDRRARRGLAALLNRRLVAPAVLQRYLDTGPRDLDVRVATRRAVDGLLDVFASMP